MKKPTKEKAPSKRDKGPTLPVKIMEYVLAPILLVGGTAVIFFISKGYQFNITEGTLEQTAIISVRSEPRRADISIDSKYKGKTPRTIPGISEGIHTVGVTKDGYQDWTIEFPIEGEQSIPINAVLFLKEPIIETIFPEKSGAASDQTTQKAASLIDKFYFDPLGQTVIFTNLISSKGTTEFDTLQVYSYQINKRFWELSAKPEIIAEFRNPSESSNIPSIDFNNYNLSVSSDEQRILFSTKTEGRDHFYLLNTTSSNTNLQEITELRDYSEIVPTWSQDSRTIIFSKNGELRLYNTDTKFQVILLEINQDINYTWTTAENGYIYILEQDANGYTITRTRNDGQDRTAILEKSSNQSSPMSDIASIQISPDNKYLILVSESDITVFDVENNEEIVIKTQTPKFISFSSDNTSFIYTSQGDTSLYQYILSVEDGHPLYQIGPKQIANLEGQISDVRWHPDLLNVFFTTPMSDGTGQVSIKVVNLQSTQVFDILTQEKSDSYSVGNSGSFIVTRCGDSLCKVTVTE